MCRYIYTKVAHLLLNLIPYHPASNKGVRLVGFAVMVDQEAYSEDGANDCNSLLLHSKISCLPCHFVAIKIHDRVLDSDLGSCRLCK